MAMTEYKIIRNDDQYELYLERFSELFGLDFANNPDLEEEFDLLALLIKDYEDKNYPIDNPSPVDYIKFIMDQKGLSNKDMEKYLGSPSKVSEVLNGKRNLSLNMVKKLHNGLGIPADILIKDINIIDGDDSGGEPLKNLIMTYTSTFSNHFFTPPEVQGDFVSLEIQENSLLRSKIVNSNVDDYLINPVGCYYQS